MALGRRQGRRRVQSRPSGASPEGQALTGSSRPCQKAHRSGGTWTKEEISRGFLIEFAVSGPALRAGTGPLRWGAEDASSGRSGEETSSPKAERSFSDATREWRDYLTIAQVQLQTWYFAVDSFPCIVGSCPRIARRIVRISGFRRRSEQPSALPLIWPDRWQVSRKPLPGCPLLLLVSGDMVTEGARNARHLHSYSRS